MLTAGIVPVGQTQTAPRVFPPLWSQKSQTDVPLASIPVSFCSCMYVHAHGLLYLNSCDVTAETASGKEDKMQSCGVRTNVALLLWFTSNV